MNTPAQQAACVTPPFASATPGEGVTVIATDTTSRTYDLDAYDAFYARYVDFRADGGKVYILLDADSTGNILETTAGAAGAATALTDGTTEATCWPLADGETISIRMSKTTHRYLHVKGASGTAYLRIRPSSPKV